MAGVVGSNEWERRGTTELGQVGGRRGRRILLNKSSQRREGGVDRGSLKGTLLSCLSGPRWPNLALTGWGEQSSAPLSLFVPRRV